MEASQELVSNSNESEANLGWLKEGTHYACRKAVGGLQENQVYQYEGFSSDPLGDTRQYLFRDLKGGGDFHGVELSGDMPTPIWPDHLTEADS